MFENNLHFSDAEKASYRAVYAPVGTSDAQWNIFLTECERRALIPGTHVVFQLRNTMEWDPNLQQKVPVKKVAFITTINALRLIADRSKRYRGHRGFLYYYPSDEGGGITTRIPGLDEKTGKQIAQRVHAVSGEFIREGWEPQFIVARLEAYAQKKNDGTLTSMWANRTPEQLAKCLEALGLRTIAPEECGGLYISEEMPDEDIMAPVNNVAPAQTPVKPPAPIVPLVVNQAPASIALNPSLETVQQPTAEQLEAQRILNKANPPKDETIHKAGKELDRPVIFNPPSVAAPASGLFTGLDENGKPCEIGVVVAKPFPELTPVVHLPAPVIVTAPTPQPKTESPVSPASAPTILPVAIIPASKAERDIFLARAAKVLRDMLVKTPLKAPNDLLKAYFLRGARAEKLTAISAFQWEDMLHALETAGTPEAAAELVKGALK